MDGHNTEKTTATTARVRGPRHPCPGAARRVLGSGAPFSALERNRFGPNRSPLASEDRVPVFRIVLQGTCCRDADEVSHRGRSQSKVEGFNPEVISARTTARVQASNLCSADQKTGTPLRHSLRIPCAKRLALRRTWRRTWRFALSALPVRTHSPIGTNRTPTRINSSPNENAAT